MMKPNVSSHSRARALFVVLAAIAPRAAIAATTGANGTHDPSRIIESSGRFYFCGTGGRCASSTDGLAWTSTGLRIPVPSWSAQYEPGGNQGIWAPDIIFYNGTYHIYYAMAGLPATHAPCVVGLYTTPTLDSTAANFKLTDGGMVVNNPMNTTAIQFSAIDPAPIIDPMGNFWTAWGSGYGKDVTKLQIWVTRLDMTGLPLATDPAFQPPDQPGYGLEPGAIEASYIYFHDGFYYLFWNSGGCCNGAASTYTIHVARSQGITGPYGSARVFYASNGSIHGPGHIGIYDACGAMRFTYHYYPDTGGSVLGENELSWGSDGFPVAGDPSTTPLKPCGQFGSSGTGSVTSGSGAGGANGAGGARAGAGGSIGAGGSAGGGQDPTGSLGGAGGEGGVSGSRGAGGSAAPAGAGGASGSTGNAPGETPGSGGCACQVEPTMDLRSIGSAALLLIAAASATRRRRRR